MKCGSVEPGFPSHKGPPASFSLAMLCSACTHTHVVVSFMLPETIEVPLATTYYYGFISHFKKLESLHALEDKLFVTNLVLLTFGL